MPAPSDPVRNVDDLYQRELTGVARLAIRVAELIGSWRFIVAQSAVLGLWVALNIVGWANQWDPYPFTAPADGAEP